MRKFLAAGMVTLVLVLHGFFLGYPVVAAFSTSNDDRNPGKVVAVADPRLHAVGIGFHYTGIRGLSGAILGGLSGHLVYHTLQDQARGTESVSAVR